jgi:hypothetical protein
MRSFWTLALSAIVALTLMSGKALAQVKIDDKTDYGPGAADAESPSDIVPIPDSLDEDDDYVAEDYYVDTTDSLASAPSSIAPNMIGDFIAIGGNSIVGADLVGTAYGTAPSPSAFRYKISEDNSPFPRNRIFVTYNLFDDAFVADNTQFVVQPQRKVLDIHRFVLGFEKTFWHDRASFQLHLPFFTSTDFSTPNFGYDSGTAVGNLQLTTKLLLAGSCRSALSAGFSLTTPTGSDVVGNVNAIDFTIENESVHIMPFVGFYRSLLHDRAYIQAFAQLDLDLNGNSVTGTDTFNVPFKRVYQDQNLLYFDLSGGYWLYQNPCCHIQGLAGILELHYTTTVQDTDVAAVNDGFSTLAIGNVLNRVDIFTLTVGTHVELQRSNLRAGFVVPLGGDELPSFGINERPFDWELAIQYNFRF